MIRRCRLWSMAIYKSHASKSLCRKPRIHRYYIYSARGGGNWQFDGGTSHPSNWQLFVSRLVGYVKKTSKDGLKWTHSWIETARRCWGSEADLPSQVIQLHLATKVEAADHRGQKTQQDEPIFTLTTQWRTLYKCDSGVVVVSCYK